MDREIHREKGEVRDSGHVATQLFDTKQIPEDTRVTDTAVSYFETQNSNSETLTKALVAVRNIICYHKICEENNISNHTIFVSFERNTVTRQTMHE